MSAEREAECGKLVFEFFAGGIELRVDARVRLFEQVDELVERQWRLKLRVHDLNPFWGEGASRSGPPG